MKVLPGRGLLLAMAIPLVLAAGALLEPSLVGPMLAADVAIAIAALVDLALVRRAELEVSRQVASTASLARALPVTLEVRSLSRRRLAVQLVDAVFEHAATEGLPLAVDLPAGATRAATYQLRAMRRGPGRIGDTWARYPSPAGLWVRQLRLPGDSLLRVYPDVVAVRNHELLARQDRDVAAARRTRARGGDTEFERLRDFLPDDDFRRIDWRATARRAKLTAREHQLERNQSLVILLDCGRAMTARWHGLTALDHALNATLMLGHVAVRRGDQVGLVAFDEVVTRVLRPSGGLSASSRLIGATYDLFPRMVEPDHDAAFAALHRHIRRRTLIVFITHALDEQTTARVQRLCRDLLPRHLPLCVILEDSELDARAHRAAGSPEEACVQAAAAGMLLWRERARHELERSGVLTLSVTPDRLSGALVSRYLEVKARGLL